MKLAFLSGFEKDLRKTKDKRLAEIVLECIQLFEKAEKLDDIPNVKKIKGHKTAYRYRKGRYRIGFYFNNNLVTFAAFAPRDKVYKQFP